jgi:hypothetical protein
VLHIVKNVVVVVVVAETFDDYMDSALDVVGVAAFHHPMVYSAHVVPSVTMAMRMMMKSPVVVAVEDP